MDLRNRGGRVKPSKNLKNKIVSERDDFCVSSGAEVAIYKHG